MKQKTKYRTLKPTDSVCAGDALYVNDVFAGRFVNAKHLRTVDVLNRISGRKIKVRRKHKQRNKTKARWL